MTRTLPFAHRLLEIGQKLERLGQAHAAVRLLSRVASLRDLPPKVAETAHLSLADLYLKCGHARKARRQLSAALAAEPDNARAHYVMAGAIEDDETCNPQRALKHYRRCARLEPDNPAYWSAYGLCALRNGDRAAGLKALRRAYDLAPADLEILDEVAQGLREAGESAEVKELLRSALFRHPRDRRYRALWMKHQFEALHADQHENHESNQATDKRAPVILPFVRPAPGGNPPSQKRIRRDLPSGTPGPKMARWQGDRVTG
jgi:Tfp pilus assembly protein PilF